MVLARQIFFGYPERGDPAKSCPSPRRVFRQRRTCCGSARAAAPILSAMAPQWLPQKAISPRLDGNLAFRPPLLALAGIAPGRLDTSRIALPAALSCLYPSKSRLTV